MKKSIFKFKKKNKKITKSFNNRNDYPVVYDSDFGKVEHISAFHCIKDGVNIYEF